MRIDFNIKALIASCFLILATLSLIQFYLVKNTYELTKDKYYTEVKRSISKIANLPNVLSIQEKAQENLKLIAYLYANKKISREIFFSELKNKCDSINDEKLSFIYKQIESIPALKGVWYKIQYDEIIIEYNNKSDTILSTSNPPFLFLGESFGKSNSILLSQGNNISYDNKLKAGTFGHSDNDNIRLLVKQSQYINASKWKSEVIRRMVGVFILAVSLMIAVIIMFYFVFSAMIKQKKIVDIKTDFANNITHELKTPLSSVSLVLKSLQRRDVQENAALLQELIQALGRQHDKIQRTVDIVLESSMSTKIMIENNELDITEYLIQYCKDMSIKTHSLICDIMPEKQSIKTNKYMLEKILNNLIENAVKYCPKESNIKLSGYVRSSEYCIDVSDEGPGIITTYQPYIFDKFYRIPEQNKHTVKGLGLGLYLSKQATRQLGGNLTLKSKLGKGSTFTIALPL